MPKSVVSIVKGTDAEKMVEEALSYFGGITSLIKPGAVVVVKPNSIGGRPPERATSTSPAMVGAVIKELRKAQPKEIIMAEGIKGETLEGFEVNGQKRAAEEAGVDKIINIRTEKDLIKVPIRDHRSGIESILLPRFLVEADHIVNLPIFKTHVSMMYTGALKNIFGILGDADRRRMHWNGVSVGLMDLWSVCKADLQIVDMIHPGEGYGPLAPLPTDFGCVVAGKDPVAVDATICRMVGLDIKKVAYFEAIRERGFGNYEEEDIELRGRKIEEVFKRLWTPYLEGFERYPEYKIHINQGSCFLCEGLVAWSLERLKSLGEYDKNAGMSIVLGHAKELPKGVKPRDLILMGNCVKKFRDQGIFVEGCPPWEMHPAWPIIERRWVDDISGWKRNYAQEIDTFIDYEKKMRDQRKEW